MLTSQALSDLKAASISIRLRQLFYFFICYVHETGYSSYSVCQANYGTKAFQFSFTLPDSTMMVRERRRSGIVAVVPVLPLNRTHH